MAASAPARPVIDDDDAPVAAPKTKGKPKKANQAAAPIEEAEQEEPKGKKEKKAKKEKAPKLPGEKKKGKAGLVILLLLLLLIGGIVAVVLLNPLGVRDKYLSGILGKIPIVNSLVTPPEEAAGPTAEELAAEVAALTRQNDAKDAEIDRLNNTVSAFTTEVNRLREFEDYQTAAKAAKAEFDSEIALGRPADYQKYYEQIDPANAEALYREVVGITVSDKELKNYVATFTDMDEGEAAKILEALVATDMNQVVMILKNLGADQRGAILGKFTPAVAARVVKALSPAAS